MGEIRGSGKSEAAAEQRQDWRAMELGYELRGALLRRPGVMGVEVGLVGGHLLLTVYAGCEAMPAVSSGVLDRMRELLG